MEKLGENRKKWRFSKASLYSISKIPDPRLLGLDIFPDPIVICNPTFIREIRVVKKSFRHSKSKITRTSKISVNTVQNMHLSRQKTLDTYEHKV